MKSKLSKTLHMLKDQISLHRMRAISRVPKITALFWAIKLLTTGMGETTSDFLMHQINPIFAVALGGGGLTIALLMQFSARKYIPWIYWLAVIMVAIFGTMVADVIHGLGIPYLLSTAGFSVVLGAIFVAWYKSEKTLSIHRIFTFRRELFYWATVMATFALGTAAGDMTASTLGLGFFTSGLLFTLLFALPAIAYWRFGLNEISAFWFAYILTRPLGASFADWLAHSQNHGGAGFGTGPISLILAILIVGLIFYSSLRPARGT